MSVGVIGCHWPPAKQNKITLIHILWTESLGKAADRSIRRFHLSAGSCREGNRMEMHGRDTEPGKIRENSWWKESCLLPLASRGYLDGQELWAGGQRRQSEGSRGPGFSQEHWAGNGNWELGPCYRRLRYTVSTKLNNPQKLCIKTIHVTGKVVLTKYYSTHWYMIHRCEWPKHLICFPYFC